MPLKKRTAAGFASAALADAAKKSSSPVKAKPTQTKTSPSSLQHASTKQASQAAVWVVKLCIEYRWDPAENETHVFTYSSLAKMMEKFPAKMDKKNGYGDDWRNGLPGFGREHEENYCSYECVPLRDIDKHGGGEVKWLWQDNEETDNDATVTVWVKKAKVDA